MSISLESLAQQNAGLILHISEQSHTTTIVRDGIPEGEKEGHSSCSDRHQEENEDREGPDHSQLEANYQDLH